MDDIQCTDLFIQTPRVGEEISKLLTAGVDLAESMPAVLGRIKCIPGVEKACIVPFAAEAGGVFCCDDASVFPQGCTPEAIAAQLMPSPPRVLEGQVLRALATADMPESFREKDMLLVPLLFEGKPIGAALCCISGSLSAEARNELCAICELIAIALRNTAVNKRQSEQAQALATGKSLADGANQVKSDFLSRMSHELRTPVNAILGMARIAVGKPPEKTGEYMKVIEDSATQLLSLINDLLDMSDIEAQRLSVCAQPFDLDAALKRLAGDVAPKVENKLQKLHVHMDVSVPTRLVGDEQRILQIITNFLQNAIKFTPSHGRILLNVHEAKRGDGESTLIFSVIDTGIGISDAAQKKLFDSFEQGDGTQSRKYGGTGLGLALCKRLSDLMGGVVSVRSEEHKGSTFTFRVTLPFVEPPPAAHNAPHGVDLAKMNVLIADSDPETTAYFLGLMRGFKIRADAAASYAECIGKLQSADAIRHPFNTLFLDATLSGCEITTIVEGVRDWFDGSLIILLPNKNTAVDESAIARYNIVKLLAKPFLPPTVFDTLQELSGGGTAEASACAGLQLYAGYNVLLAEDNPVNRAVLTRALRAAGVIVHQAENGEAAVEMFVQAPDLYDLILMDVQMPLLDGYEATRQIRALPLERAGLVPIVAVTAYALEEDIRRSLDSGMNGHLMKPVAPDKALAALQQYFMQDTHNKKAAAPPMSAAGEKENESMSTPYQPPVDFVNVEEALGRVRGNQKIYKVLLNSFLNNTNFASLEADIAANNSVEGVKSAHAVKGIAANLSLPALYKIAVQLEAEMKTGSFQPETAADMRRTYATTYDHVKKLFESM